MRMTMVRAWAAGTALLALGTFAACGDGGGGGGGGTGVQTGTVSGQVSVGGTGLAGVTVSLSGGGTQQTNASGGYSFASVSAGAREVTITLPAGHITANAADPTTRSVSVAAGGTATASFALKKGVVVTASGTTFSPSAVQIDPGATVRWVNGGGGVHTVTPTTAGQAGGFAAASLGAGATFEHTFAQAGTYAYLCVPHETMGMTGTVTVGGGGAPVTGSVSGQVSAAGVGMAGVSLSLNGATATTDASGNYTFANVPAGDRPLTLTLPAGHITAAAADRATRTVTVAGGATATANFTLKRGVEVSTVGTTFVPPTVTVPVGGTVRWRNGGGSHTVTPSTFGQAGAWTSAELPAGEAFEHTFATAGAYDYHCSPHRSVGMTGTVTVAGQ